MKITSELFSIPHGGNFILYAPLKRRVFLVNSGTIGLLRKIADKGNAEEKEMQVLEELVESGIIDGDPETRPIQPEWNPVSVTIYPTMNCNLRCVYCYSEGGSSQEIISRETAEAAVDFALKNASQSEESLHLNFHGGGEPTLAWDLIRDIHESTSKKCDSNRVNLAASISTNGAIPLYKLEWLSENIESIQVSMDGLPELQNTQRPNRDGSGSFSAVSSTLEYLSKKGKDHNIRVTVTDRSVLRLPEIIEFISSNYSTRHINVEPASECGRCRTSKVYAPGDEDFISSFLEAKAAAESKGIDLSYSGCSVESLKPAFCGVSTPNFIVTPAGLVTACFEVCRPDDRAYGIAVYGRYNSLSRSFGFDQQKIDFLRQRNVDNLPYCSRCFVKWHCAGDCLSGMENPDSYLNPAESGRCRINQELTKNRLLELLNQNPG